MSTGIQVFRRSVIASCAFAMALLVAFGNADSARAGHANVFGRSVGGIRIHTDGIVREISAADKAALVKNLRATADKLSPELTLPVKLRKISLRSLEAAVEESLKNNQGELPDAIRYLGGLQRIEYILVYPEQNDIVIAGPAEGWKINDEGNVVGITTGQPVLRLDDFIIAMRTVNAARTEGISVSIDPTEEGRRNFVKFMSNQRTFNRSVVAALAEVMGPQEISITGVPGDSHFARVMVAADYRMKRLAMKLEETPVKDIPSFLDLLKMKRKTPGNAMPRWWMACNYEPLAKSADGLVWQIRGQGVKTMTEDEFINPDGSVTETGREDPIAAEWAKRMTEHYNELAQKNLVFAELRNIMDMCVVAAVIEKHRLADLAGCALPTITQQQSPLEREGHNAARTVATQCSYLKIGREYVITASGGVQIESWEVAARNEVKPEIKAVHAESTAQAGGGWWWN